MSPPNYRGEEKVPGMIFPKACKNCIHERQMGGRPVCLRYLCYLRLYRVCDDWDGGEKTLKDADSDVVVTFLHEHEPDGDEAGYLRGGPLEELPASD